MPAWAKIGAGLVLALVLLGFAGLKAMSNKFGPLVQIPLGPRDATGVELFYNIQVTPWLNVTPDVQFIRPGLGAIATDDAFIYGLRVNMAL